MQDIVNSNDDRRLLLDTLGEMGKRDKGKAKKRQGVSQKIPPS
jgi:hypothetical protein